MIVFSSPNTRENSDPLLLMRRKLIQDEIVALETKKNSLELETQQIMKTVG